MFHQPTVDLYNTPGIYYAAAYWISSMIFIAVLSKRKKTASVRAKQILILIVLSVFMTVSHHQSPVFHFPCMAIVLALVCANLYISCSLTGYETIYYGLRVFMVGELAAALDWQIFYYGLTTLGMPMNMKTNLLFLLPSWFLVFILTYFVERALYKIIGRPEIEKNTVISLFIIVLFFYALSNISYLFKGTAFTASGEQELFIFRTLSDLGCVGISAMFHGMIGQMSARIESEKMNQMLRMQYASYKISEESIALVNRKYHDLKHQIAFLRSSTDDTERNTYLDRMEDEIRTFEAKTNSGNEVLDAILGTKILQCMNENIDFHVMADGTVLDFMDKMDVSALFGNILDNAIEAASKVKEGGERRIRLYVSEKKGFVKVLAENTYAGDLLFEDGVPLTTKQFEKGYHGFGVRSIRAIAEKYGGSAMMKIDGDWFQVHLLLPAENTVHV